MQDGSHSGNWFPVISMRSSHGGGAVAGGALSVYTYEQSYLHIFTMLPARELGELANFSVRQYILQMSLFDCLRTLRKPANLL